MYWLRKALTAAGELNKQNWRQIRAILDAADESLPPEAQEAITTFVGHGPKGRDAEYSPFFLPLMKPDMLEDAYSPQPSPQGMKIRQQIEQAFAPVRSQLSLVLGDPIFLYRFQRNGPYEGVRHTLSWTANKEFAEDLRGPDYSQYHWVMDGYPQYISYCSTEAKAQEIADALNMAGGLTPELIEKYDLDESYGDAQPPFTIKKEDSTDLPTPKGEILSQQVPLSQVVWATDRANQMEFILRTEI